MLIHYCIDENHGNPFKVGEEMGAPENPSAEQFAILRKNQELALLEKPRMVTIKGGKLKMEFDLLLHVRDKIKGKGFYKVRAIDY